MTSDSGLHEQVSDTITTGLKTDDRRDRDSPTLNIAWINWDSGFRSSSLIPGDQIVAVNDELMRPHSAGTSRDHMVGQAQESAYWKERGARDGMPVRLTVRRRRMPGEGWETIEITAALRGERNYFDVESRRLLGSDGPQRLARDGFTESWSSWYGKRVYDWQRQIDGTVWVGHTDTRMELARHMEAEPRVRFLSEHYPGTFSKTVLDDWTTMRELLAGRTYQVPEQEYAYRSAENQLTANIAAAACNAWNAFQAMHAADVIVHPGKISIAEGDHEKLAGKLLVLPSARPEDWVSDVGQVFVSWHQNEGWAFTALEQPILDRMWHAQLRYRRHLSPQIDDNFSLIGKILPQPKMVSPKGERAVIGVEVEPMAALMGHGEEEMFVDLTVERDGISRYAGEETIMALHSSLPPDDATPRQVLEALIAALYARDVETWFALFADWQVITDEGRHFYYPYYPYAEANRDPHWDRSRRIVLEQTFAIRVAWIDEPRVVVEDAIPDLPKIERVTAELDHVGLFDGEYRAFNSAAVHRIWTLERRDGGPWRITSHQGI